MQMQREEKSGFSKPVRARFSGKFAAPVRIMVVDDDREFREETGAFLKSLGYSVTLDGGGKLVAKRIRRVRPDLVLLDIKMEKINGLQVALELAGEPSGGSAPIVAMTGYYRPAEIDRFLSLGVIQACLAKPFSGEALAVQIENTLQRGPRAAPPDGPDM